VLTATTLDQTRVWVGVTSLTLVALAASVTRDSVQEGTSAQQKAVLGSALIAFIVMPALEVTFSGTVRIPLEWMYGLGMSALYLLR